MEVAASSFPCVDRGFICRFLQLLKGRLSSVTATTHPLTDVDCSSVWTGAAIPFYYRAPLLCVSRTLSRFHFPFTLVPNSRAKNCFVSCASMDHTSGIEPRFGTLRCSLLRRLNWLSISIHSLDMMKEDQPYSVGTTWYKTCLYWARHWIPGNEIESEIANKRISDFMNMYLFGSDYSESIL
jgi:hypothetical protein